METAGIVAEYNPFHRGHAWHIAETRRRLGGEAPVVCVMSGHWVQRGECALADKWLRAALALDRGADLVVELPTPWAMASAESFARGAVSLLAATGVVLMVMQSEFVPMDTEHRKIYYMAKRERFNDLKINGNEDVNIEKAALMIFLNKTCFNGLFRVNKKGLFNVPMGSYKNPMICDEENLRAVSEKLQNVKIVCGDYRESADFIDENTFVYFDPPYRPITDTASFTAYTENLFNDEEQIELARFVDDMHKKGAKVVISNSDPKNSNPEDNFFDNIYSSHKIKRVEATRMINCNSEARGKIKELLISNY